MNRIELFEKIRTADANDTARFQEIISVLLNDGYWGVPDLAVFLKIPAETVTHWRDGITSPRPATRLRMYEDILYELR